MPQHEIHFDHRELESYLLHQLPAPDEIILEDHLRACGDCAGRMKTVADWLVALQAAIKNGCSAPGMSIPTCVSALTQNWAVESVRQAVRRPQVRLQRAAVAGALAGVGLFAILVQSPPQQPVPPEQELQALAPPPQAPALTVLSVSDNDQEAIEAQTPPIRHRGQQAMIVNASLIGPRPLFQVPIRARRVSLGSVELPPPPAVRPARAAMALPREVRFAPPPRGNRFKRAMLGLWPFRARREEPRPEPLRISYTIPSRFPTGTLN